MKNLFPILLVLFFMTSCKEKEECKACVNYLISNQIEAQKKCDGQTYDLSDFQERIIGGDFGTACTDEEKMSIEGEISREKKELCSTSEYTEIIVVRCDFEN